MCIWIVFITVLLYGYLQLFIHCRKVFCFVKIYIHLHAKLGQYINNSIQK